MEKGTLTKPWKKQWVFLCLILCHRCISDTSELARSDWKCRILIPPRLRDNQSLMKGKCWIPSILPSPRKPVGCVMQTNLIQESAFFCLLLFLVLVHVQTHIQRERKMEKKRERERDHVRTSQWLLLKIADTRRWGWSKVGLLGCSLIEWQPRSVQSHQKQNTPWKMKTRACFFFTVWGRVGGRQL